MLSKYLLSVINTNEGTSWNNVIQILLCFMMEDIRKGITYSIKQIIDNIIFCSTFLFNLIVQTAASIKSFEFRCKRQTEGTIITRQTRIIHNDSMYVFTLAGNSSVLKAIINGIYSGKYNSSYESDDIPQWNMDNMEEGTITKTWNNINFEIPQEIRVDFIGQVNITFGIRGAKLHVKNAGASSFKTHDPDIQIVNPRLLTFMSSTEFSAALIDNPILFGIRDRMPNTLNNIQTITNSELYDIITILPELHAYPRTLTMLTVIHSRVDEFGCYNEQYTHSDQNVNWAALMGLIVPIRKKQLDIKSLYSALTDDEIKTVIEKCSSYKNSDAFIFLCKRLWYARKGLTIIKTSQIRNNDYWSKYLSDDVYSGSSIKLLLSSSVVERSKLEHEFINWMQNLVTPAIKFGIKQKIYYLSIKRTERIEKNRNPAFDEWKETASIFNSSVENASKPDSHKPHLLEIIGSPPLTYLEIKHIDVKIEKKEMREIFKPLETLYLPEKDCEELRNAIGMFRDEKDVLLSLGLPNKFGLFIFGPPGTGKTSTIYAVASELGKPVYYIHLRHDITCREFQMMLDHVYKETIGGGVIVFEEVDVMTTAIHKTDAISVIQPETISCASVTDDVPLNLSYFLNVLDGALTMDGSVIICTSNHRERIDEAFMRVGRFDMILHMDKAVHSQIRAIAHRMLSIDIADDILEHIPERQFSPAEIIYHLKNYRLNKSISQEVIFAPFMKVNKVSIDV